MSCFFKLSKLCQKTGLEYKEDMQIACQHYCDDLKLNYKRTRLCMQKTNGHNESETWVQMNRIFGGYTPSTSKRRSSQSRRNTSSRSSGHLNKSKLHDALGELAYSGHLDFDEIGRVEQYVTKCKTSLHVFMGGSQEYRASVVRKYLENDSQVPNSVWQTEKMGTQL